MDAWLKEPAKELNSQVLVQAKAYQQTLTKPPGSLGLLETVAEKFSVWQSTLQPDMGSISIAIFAGDHGIFHQGVSAFPQEVTVQMIANFLHGGAAISVLARDLNADFHVVNTGVATELSQDLIDKPQLINRPVAFGTSNFSIAPAMTFEQLDEALSIGRDVANEVTANVFIGGEMGIANTTSASAIYAALLSLSPESTVGSGTGIDKQGLLRKQAAIQNALNLHKDNLNNPYNVLAHLGGFEIAALTGSFITCAQRGIPVLVDGFICTAAALAAVRLNKSVIDWLLFSHCSAEPAHKLALDVFGARPLLDLDLRLGEGSGAALAVPLIKSALSLHNNMATFSELGIDNN